MLAVTALNGNRVIAAYEDRSLREWRRRPGAGWESQVVATLDHKADFLHITPTGHLIASGDGTQSTLEITSSNPLVVMRKLQERSPSHTTAPATTTAISARDGDYDGILATWLELTSGIQQANLRTDEDISACAQVDGKLYAVATSNAVHVRWRDDNSPVTIDTPGVTCLALQIDEHGGEDDILLAVGNTEGSVILYRASLRGTTTQQWHRDLHQGPVTTVLLDPAEKRVITGGTDRSICITPIVAQEDDKQPLTQRLHLTLRCRNVRYEGVRPPSRQGKLRQYSAN